MALRFSPSRGTASIVLNALTRGPTGAAATIAAGTASALASTASPTVTNSGTSSAATFDFGMPAGLPFGLRFAFSTTTAKADPGAGTVRFNNATISSVTEIYIDDLESGGTDISAILDLLDDPTASTSATLMFTDEGDPTNFAFFKVTGAVTDETGYRSVVVSGGVGSADPPFADAADTAMFFALSADNGALNNVVEDLTPHLGGALDGQGEDVTGIGVLTLVEQAAAEADVAGRGQLWVKTATPNELWFTDDAGTDFQIGTLDGTETLTNKTLTAPILVLTDANGAAPTTDGEIKYDRTAETLEVGDGAATKVFSDDTQLLSVANDLSDVSSAATAFSNIKQAATTSATGVSELAIASELNTGTDATRAVTPDALAGSNYGTGVVPVLIHDDGTACAVKDGAGDVFWRVPSILNGWDLVDVAACVFTAGTTGTMDIQIRNITQAADMLSTKITIDSAEKDSSTAATPAVIDTANDDVATGDQIAIDIDVLHTTPATGLLVELQFRLP